MWIVKVYQCLFMIWATWQEKFCWVIDCCLQFVRIIIRWLYHPGTTISNIVTLVWTLILLFCVRTMLALLRLCLHLSQSGRSHVGFLRSNRVLTWVFLLSAVLQTGSLINRYICVCLWLYSGWQIQCIPAAKYTVFPPLNTLYSHH